MGSPTRRPVRLGTIRSRMLTTFALTLGVLVLITSVSILVMRQVQSVVDRFIEEDLPRSQSIYYLNHLVESVALGSQRLAQAQTREGLQESIDQVDALLLRLDIAADGLSRRGVDSDTLRIMHRLQLVRAEAQLGFQLKGVALALQSDLEEGRARGLDSAARLLDLVPPPGDSRDLRPLVQKVTLILARPQPATEESHLTDALSDLGDALRSSPPGSAAFRRAFDDLAEIDWPRHFEQGRRQVELEAKADAVLGDLQRSVAEVVERTDDYTQGLLSGFERRKGRVLEVERWALLLILLVSLAAAAVIVLVQRQLVMEGFSRRLEIISRALGRLPKTPEDTRVAVVGEDEIATMARRLEVLLDKALEIQIVVKTDELTQVNNRRSFFDLTAMHRKQAFRSRRTDSLLMMDLDHFKRINDHHGHDVGDEVLRTVAQTCLSCLRETDVLARIGGEEFAIYCPETTLEAASELAKRVCDTVRSLDFASTGTKVTLSVGIVEIPPDADSLAPWLKRADQALYQAKDEGRDRVVLATPPVAPQRDPGAPPSGGVPSPS